MRIKKYLVLSIITSLFFVALNSTTFAANGDLTVKETVPAADAVDVDLGGSFYFYFKDANTDNEVDLTSLSLDFDEDGFLDNIYISPDGSSEGGLAGTVSALGVVTKNDGDYREYKFTSDTTLLPGTLYVAVIPGGPGGLSANSGADTLDVGYAWYFTTVSNQGVPEFSIYLYAALLPACFWVLKKKYGFEI